VLIFLPFQAITRLAGINALLPTSTVAIGLAAFAAFALVYLVIRFIHVYFPRTSLGTELLCILGALGATNIPYLFFKPDFYTLPMSASMLLTFFGLWFWLKAKSAPSSTAFRWRIALGSLLIAANIGCRPTFLIAALLAFPIFWDEIRKGTFFSCLRFKEWPHVFRSHIFRSLKADCAALVPAITVIIPILWFNFWRFGSWLDFGNSYQITVSDMQTYHSPLAELPLAIWYYLGQPLRFTSSFPFIGLAPTPFPSQSIWAEPQIGGYFALAPFALLLVVVIAALFMRKRHENRHALPCIVTMIVLGVFMCVFDAFGAGLSWRYMTDFAWLLTFPAIGGACILESHTRPHWHLQPGQQGIVSARRPSPAKTAAFTLIVRIALALLVGLTLLIIVMSFFVPGRYNDLLTTNPSLFFDAASSFN
jgi:hypothetical protein